MMRKIQVQLLLCLLIIAHVPLMAQTFVGLRMESQLSISDPGITYGNNMNGTGNRIPGQISIKPAFSPSIFAEIDFPHGFTISPELGLTTGVVKYEVNNLLEESRSNRPFVRFVGKKLLGFGPFSAIVGGSFIFNAMTKQITPQYSRSTSNGNELADIFAGMQLRAGGFLFTARVATFILPMAKIIYDNKSGTGEYIQLKNPGSYVALGIAWRFKVPGLISTR